MQEVELYIVNMLNMIKKSPLKKSPKQIRKSFFSKSFPKKVEYFEHKALNYFKN